MPDDAQETRESLLEAAAARHRDAIKATRAAGYDRAAIKRANNAYLAVFDEVARKYRVSADGFLTGCTVKPAVGRQASADAGRGQPGQDRTSTLAP
jgi:hypothetical protein